MNQFLAFIAIIVAFALIGLLISGYPAWLSYRDEQNLSKSKKGSYLLVFSAACLTITLFWLLGWLILPLAYGSPTDVGNAGDMFGVLTSWFSGLAFAGLIATLWM